MWEVLLRGLILTSVCEDSKIMRGLSISWDPGCAELLLIPAKLISLSIYIYISCTQTAAAALAQLWHTQGGPKCPRWGLRIALPLPRQFSFLCALLGTAHFGTWIPSDFGQADLVCLGFVKGAKVWGEFLPWLKGAVGPHWVSAPAGCWWLHRCYHSSAELFRINRWKAFV